MGIRAISSEKPQDYSPRGDEEVMPFGWKRPKPEKRARFPIREVRTTSHRPLETAARHLFLTGLERDLALPRPLKVFSRVFYMRDMQRARMWAGAELTRALQKDKPLWNALKQWTFADVDRKGDVRLSNDPRRPGANHVRLLVESIRSGFYVKKSFEHPVKNVRRAA